MPKWKLGLLLVAVGSLTIALSVHGGCFSPNYSNGFACGPNLECPSGFACVMGACWPGGNAPDAGVGDATATVYDRNGVLKSNVVVVFHQANGTPIGTVRTNASGQATHVITAGGMITVGQDLSMGGGGGGLQADLTTVIGVVPGQNVIFGPKPVVDDVVAHPTFQLPFGPPAAATSFQIDVGCKSFSTSSATAPVSFDVTRRCLSSGNTFTAVAYAFDNQFKVLAYAYKRNIGVATAGTINFDSQWVLPPFPTFTANVSNAPAHTGMGCSGDAGSSNARDCATARIDTFANGINFNDRLSNGSINFALQPGGSATVGIPYAKEAFDTIQYQINLKYGPGATDGNGFYLRGFTNRPDSDSVDLANSMLPRLQNLVLNTQDVSHITFNWATDAPIVGADAMFVILTWTAPGDAGSPINRSWIIVAPASTPSPLALPQLPSDLSTVAPFSGVTFNQPGLLVFDLSLYNGFTDFMNQLGLQLFNSNGFPSGNFTGRASGTSFN